MSNIVKGTRIRVTTDKWKNIPRTPRPGDVGIVSEPGTPFYFDIETPAYFSQYGDIWFLQTGEFDVL